MSRIKLTASTSTERRIIDYLESTASEMLAEKINTGKKTLAGALRYVKDAAKKMAGGDGCICIEDQTVFGWIIHYFEEQDIAEKKPVAAMRVPGGAKIVAKPVVKAVSTQPMSIIDEILM